MNENRKYPISKPEKEYSEMVKNMFSRIARKYDFMNHLLSGCMDIYWRKKSLRFKELKGAQNFLDLACGTGDFGIFAAEFYPDVKIFSTDFSAKMLLYAKEKLKKKELRERIILLGADALSLPFREETFDVTAIAFGLRNIPNRTAALSEMLRVTKRGGRILVLEMTIKKDVRMIYKLYVKHLMPFLAKLFSEDPDAYLYLYDTLSSFPSPNELKCEMEQVGFSSVEVHRFWPGITHLLVGLRP
ncbi:MAG: ubiquinone/menaquinone biosynthesis methyltransferase [Deltaproteobacteria bacterium]|nr:ubiquinone/menaquinone biosynthesis methyltransferase [Deltaproteobacteria bacterium]